MKELWGDCGNFHAMYDQKMCNKLFQKADRSSMAMAPFEALISAPQQFPQSTMRVGAYRKHVFAASLADLKAQPNPIDRCVEMKTETYGAMHSRNFIDFCHDDIVAWQNLKAGQCTNQFIDQLAPTVVGGFEDLAMAYKLLKIDAVVTGITKGYMEFFVKQSDGTDKKMRVRSGVPSISYVNTQPWNLPSTNVCELWRCLVAESRKCCTYTKAYMTYETFQTIFQSPCVQEKLCCETLQQALAEDGVSVMQKLYNVQIVLVDGERPVRLEDGTKIEQPYLEEGQIIFLCNDFEATYMHLRNIDRPCGVDDCVDLLDTTPRFGSVFTIKTQNQPSQMAIIASHHFMLNFHNPQGALFVQAYEPTDKVDGCGGENTTPPETLATCYLAEVMHEEITEIVIDGNPIGLPNADYTSADVATLQADLAALGYYDVLVQFVGAGAGTVQWTVEFKNPGGLPTHVVDSKGGTHEFTTNTCTF